MELPDFLTRTEHGDIDLTGHRIGLAVGNGLVKGFVDVLAIDTAGHKIVFTVRELLELQPFHEVPGLVGKGAHFGSRHVEQVQRLAGGIREARTGCGAFLEQVNVQRPLPRLTAQMHGQQRTARTSAYNRDPERKCVLHELRSAGKGTVRFDVCNLPAGLL